MDPSSQEAFRATGDALLALAERTAQVDRMVEQTAAELLPESGASGAAVLAVGGYGRRQLFPYSDVDLLLLFPSEGAAVARKEAIAAFLQRLWDAGLRASHSVRTPEECTEIHNQNVELNVSLLDQRYVTGDRVLYADFARRLPPFLQRNRSALARNLVQLTRDRHTKFANTFYHLEPNVKDTPGGLRDYQLVRWLEQLRDPARSSAPPSSEIDDAFRFLARLRCYLHWQAGRDNNLLTFDAQDIIAEEWQHTGAAVWMREYYRRARAVHRTAVRALDDIEAQSSSLLMQFRDWRSRLSNTDFTVRGDRVHIREPQRLDVEPEFALRLFEFTARHGIAPSSEAEQRIELRRAPLHAHFAESRPLWPALAAIFRLPHAPLAVRAMHASGFLTALFPELEQIECLVVRDFYHRYTVDEHTIVGMENVRAAPAGYAELLAEVKDPAALMFAMLFHDSGKGVAGEGHVDGSLKLVRTALGRMQAPAAVADTVLFLISRHLELSSAMQSRDIFDPQTIREVAHAVETVEKLKALTLLTYADISAVNPAVMTPWRSEQLWQLYLAVYNELTRELETDRIEPDLASEALPPEFLAGFPKRYLRTHTPAEIAEHVALEASSRRGPSGRGVAVEIRQLDSAWQLTLVAADRPGLFAAVAGTLSSFGMNILRAEAFANRRGLILDTFAFADPLRSLELNPSEVDRLRATLQRVLAGKTKVADLLKNRPKPMLPSRKARIPARISFNSNASGAATLIEITAEDRPGLLYDVASAISANGANIEVVLIETQAHKAIDVFYVTAEGKKLAPEKQQVLEEALRKAIT